MRICGRALGIFCCILPSVLACAASGALMLPLAAAVFIHEAAHILVLRLVGGRLRDFRAAPFGLRLEIDESTLSVGGEALVAAAGSGANLLCAGAAALLYAAANIDLAAFGALSLLYAFVNLLPTLPLDGGRLLFILIRKITGKAVSDELEGKIHLIGMAILFSLMIFITLKDFNMFILKN